MNSLGSILKGIGIFLYVIFGLWGLIVSLSIVNQVAGFGGVVIGFFLFPVMLLAAPWYALVAWGNPAPLMVVYGGGILASMLYGIGAAIKNEV